MLQLTREIIDRLSAEIPMLKTVGGPEVLAGMANDSIGQLLPACIVVPGAGAPVAQNQLSKADLEQQEYECVLIVGYEYNQTDHAQTEAVASVLMSATRAALHDYMADTVLQRRPFKYAGRQAPSYALGYAEFPLSFTVDATI